MSTTTATLEQIVRTVQQRAEHLQPVDRGDRLDAWQAHYPENYEPVMKRSSERGDELMVTRRAHNQLLSRLSIPVQFFDRLPPGLKFATTNWFMQNGGYDREVMIRTVQGSKARAILSGAYTPLDDFDVIPMVADILGDQEVTIDKLDFTDDYTHLRILFPKTNVEVRRDDVVQHGLHITNSEVGLRAVHIEPIVYRLICKNGLMGWQAEGKTSIRHVGKADRLKDSIARAVEDARDRNHLIVGQFKDSVDKLIKEPAKLIERFGEDRDLSKEQLNQVLNAFAAAPDPSMFGIINAFTATAREEEVFERRYQLERTAGQLLTYEPPRSLN